MPSKYKTIISHGRIIKWFRIWLLHIKAAPWLLLQKNKSYGYIHLLCQLSATAGRKFFSVCFFCCFFLIGCEKQKTHKSSRLYTLNRSRTNDMSWNTDSNSVSIFLPASLIFWWLWPENHYLQPAYSTIVRHAGGHSQVFSIMDLDKQRREWSHQTHVPPLTNRSVVSTDYMLMSLSCNHTHP